MSEAQIGAGDAVFHPRYGFGIVEGLSRQGLPSRTKDETFDQALDYYDIRLLQGGSLLVPVARAQSLGLRLLINGVEAVKICLHSPAEELPESSRARAAELRARVQDSEPTALARAVRDLLAQSHGRSFTASEKAWLDKSCEHLSTEAALVDHISVSTARASIRQVVDQIIAA
jgi:RNA polymerase-interacting CarD/CdnL/TRCF family regulator